MPENPWFKQTNSFAAQKMAIPLFMEILKLGVHTFSWFNDHPPTEDPELRGCSKRCMGTGPRRTVTTEFTRMNRDGVIGEN